MDTHMLKDQPGSPGAGSALGEGHPLPSARRLVFLSHATPQDDTFAKWLATQLAIAGYEVWCDVTKLLGGEQFWSDIIEAIDACAFRFLFASTIESNRKPGTLRELRTAVEAQRKHGFKDFVVPLKVDQFPFASTQASIRDLNFVRFEENWAAGLSQLLRLLEREGAPKSAVAGPACVADWHRRSIDQRRQVVVANNKCFSNWFRLHLPKRLRFHKYAGPVDNLPAIAAKFDRPHRVHGSYLATFASEHELREQVASYATFREIVEVDPAAFIRDGDAALDIASFDAANIVSDLVRQAWDSALVAKGMRSHLLASGLAAWFFKDGHLEKNKAYFQPPGSRRSYRQLVGHKSKKTLDGGRLPDGFWHYAVSASAQLHPFPRIALRHHVIFTDDGQTPWVNAERMHRARRSVCKNWWNREWRDRLFAMCSELAQGDKEFLLPVGAQESVRVTMLPMSFVSPWTYFEDGETGLDEATDIELVEEQEFEDDDAELT